MAARRVVSEEGVAFIKAHEGFRPRASRLPDGRWLVGYSSIENGAEGGEITLEQAERRLRQDLALIEGLIDELVFAPLTQGQVDALVSFGFSIGPEAFRECGVAEVLNEGRPIDAASVFDAQVGDGVRPVDALVRRRAAEKAMFLALEGGPVPAPSALLRLGVNGGSRGPFEAPMRRSAHQDLIERLDSILPPHGASRHAESGGFDWSVLPSAPYPLRKGLAAAQPKRTAAGRDRSGAAPAGPSPAVAQWPWLVGGGGLGLIAVAVGNVRAAAAQSVAAGGAEAAWVVAMVAGVLALGAGCYYAARRLAGLED
jgi:GH24 family phage-related lysozyme (muramidase)